MKPLAIWAPVVAAVFGVFALVASTTRDTDQIYVVVDSSQQMESVWSRVPDELDRIDDRSRAEFALAAKNSRTRDETIHGFQSELVLGSVDAFAPCGFDGIAETPAARAADERILITTTANTCSTDDLDGWTIIEL